MTLRAIVMMASERVFRRMDLPKVASGEQSLSTVPWDPMPINILWLFSDYPPITSVEQRRKYKTEFDKDYAEYRQLHLIMDKARRRFANLQQELSNVNPSERKYKVTMTKCFIETTLLIINFLCSMFAGDSKSNNPGIQREQQQQFLSRQKAKVKPRNFLCISRPSLNNSFF